MPFLLDPQAKQRHNPLCFCSFCLAPQKVFDVYRPRRKNRLGRSIRNLRREAQKGRSEMPHIHQNALFSATEPAGEIKPPCQTEERIYQAVTVVAILLLLGSLWL
jgi:hypothetical protein